MVLELLEGLCAVEEAFKPDDAAGATTEQELIDGLRKVHSGNLQVRTQDTKGCRMCTLHKQSRSSFMG